MKEFSVGKEIQKYCIENQIEFMGDYSGRFMYGRKCVGIICKHDEKYNIIAELSQYLEKEFDFSLSSEIINSDEFGLDIIIYFPYISL